MRSAETASGYVIPRYVAERDPTWFHALLGAVPGHQIDFIYAPEVPQGALDRGHLGHLWRLMKYIEPRESARYAFALGNLSRDDVGYEPGHGGVAILYALRVAGVTDHAGRAMPPYAHSVLAIDRALDYGTLLEAISVFYRRFLEGSTPGGGDTEGAFYRRYFQMVQERPEEVVPFLDDYVANFDELPQVPQSKLGLDWEADPETVPARVTIVHADDEPFGNIAHTAATLGSILYRSNVRWTTITSGREIEIPGGVSIRFVPASEAPHAERPNLRDMGRAALQELRVAAARDPKGLQLHLDDLPADEATLAHVLFGAKPPGEDERRRLRRARAEAPEEPAPDSVDVSFDDVRTLQAPLESAPHEEKEHAQVEEKEHAQVEVKGQGAGSATPVPQPALTTPVPRVESPVPPAMESGPHAALDGEGPGGPKSRLGMWIGVVGAIGVIAAIFAAVAGGGGDGSAAPAASGESAAAVAAGTPSFDAPAVATSIAVPAVTATPAPPTAPTAPTATSTLTTGASTTSSSTNTAAPPRTLKKPKWGGVLL
ncbi:MAG: hypothetical protein U0441_12170 [Polyangiaceae bacterium]